MVQTHVSANNHAQIALEENERYVASQSHCAASYMEEEQRISRYNPQHTVYSMERFG